MTRSGLPRSLEDRLRVESGGHRRVRLLVPVLLFVLIVAADLHGNMGCSDSRWSIPTAVSLLDEHNFDLDEFRPALDANQFYAVERTGGHYYGMYPFGTPIVAAPAVALLRPATAAAFRLFPSLRSSMAVEQIDRGCPPMGGEPVLDLHSWFERFIASVIVAMTALMLYAIARDELSISGAVVIALLFAFGTSAWSTASRSLWQHGPSMLALTFALVLQRRASHFWLVGAVLGFACVIRPTNLIPLVLASIWVAWSHRSRLIEYAIGLSLVFVLFLLNNYHAYGVPLSPYYQGRYGHNPFVADALIGSLVSPARGLLIYSPVLLFSAAGLMAKIRQRRMTSLDATLVACVILHWIALAIVSPNWWGGFSYGSRLMTDMLPYLIYFLIPVVGGLSSPARPRRSVLLGSFALAAVSSVLIHAQGVFNREALLWNVQPITIDADSSRVWDWSYPPFLAGLIPRPNAGWDINAVKCEVAPEAPSGFATVTNRNGVVVLSWTRPQGAVALYVVENGNGPGMSDLPPREVLNASEPTLTLSRVPPGTYYARVRAKNACGMSAPSNEIRVVVK